MCTFICVFVYIHTQWSVHSIYGVCVHIHICRYIQYLCTFICVYTYIHVGT